MVSGDEDAHQTIPNTSVLLWSASAFPGREAPLERGRINGTETCHWNERSRGCVQKPSITSYSFPSATSRLIATNPGDDPTAIVLLHVDVTVWWGREIVQVRSHSGR
jgi:hypothetical protein